MTTTDISITRGKTKLSRNVVANMYDRTSVRTKIFKGVNDALRFVCMYKVWKICT
jgi:hypothetical protein